MSSARFEALEYHADQSLAPAEYTFEGDEEHGWRVARDGEPLLSLGPGYRLVTTERCGVCSTDLARHQLPFPLPQITGHEVVVQDRSGVRFVVEINASHAALGDESGCVFCARGLERHCPERLVLGIHALPGGFGPRLLAPRGGLLPVPESVPSETAVLVEPFAAALNAVRVVAPRDGERIAVLGPRRLGGLVVAALAAERRRTDGSFEILALARRSELLERARALGADGGAVLAGGERDLAEVVIDTTGSPEGLEHALALARREVHLKSTHGLPAAGLAFTTELVVDELRIEPVGSPPEERVLDLAGRDPAAVLHELEQGTPPGEMPRADAVRARSAAEVDAAIRPLRALGRAGEAALVRPRGRILVSPEGTGDPSPLVAAVARRGLVVSSSRCGDFRGALELMAADDELAALGNRFVTHRFPAEELERAFAVARAPECVKAVVEHIGPESGG